MLPWPTRSPDLSPIEHVWDIIIRQLQSHPQLAMTVPVLTQQGQQAWKYTTQSDIRHLKKNIIVFQPIAAHFVATARGILSTMDRRRLHNKCL
ncbi:uncharacterized protein TNCV_3766031 [Trichonephila clavipes]|nr:uncharacterized protein TNCV_3766031 [Trichonephila clavipes]